MAAVNEGRPGASGASGSAKWYFFVTFGVGFILVNMLTLYFEQFLDAPLQAPTTYRPSSRVRRLHGGQNDHARMKGDNWRRTTLPRLAVKTSSL